MAVSILPSGYLLVNALWVHTSKDTTTSSSTALPEERSQAEYVWMILSGGKSDRPARHSPEPTRRPGRVSRSVHGCSSLQAHKLSGAHWIGGRIDAGSDHRRLQHQPPYHGLLLASFPCNACLDDDSFRRGRRLSRIAVKFWEMVRTAVYRILA